MDYELEEKDKSEDRREKMDEPKTGGLVDTTDCLEAVSVIRCWKNLMFIIILLCLLLLLLMFLLVNFKVVKADNVESKTVATKEIGKGDEQAKPAIVDEAKIREAAKNATEDVNAAIVSALDKPKTEEAKEAAEVEAKVEKKPRLRLNLKETHAKAVVRFLDFVLIPASALYCLTMLFCMKVSLIGRLGGINHITRAFFWSLVFFVLLMPWQLMFSPVFAGAMFTPGELISACSAEKSTLASIAFYLRFVGYWLLVSLILLLAHMRSMRWASATLRRLEVI